MTNIFSVEIQEGVESTPFTDTVTIHMFLHEEAMVQEEGVTNALRLECQIIETDKYDVHMVSTCDEACLLLKINLLAFLLIFPLILSCTISYRLSLAPLPR